MCAHDAAYMAPIGNTTNRKKPPGNVNYIKIEVSLHIFETMWFWEALFCCVRYGYNQKFIPTHVRYFISWFSNRTHVFNAQNLFESSGSQQWWASDLVSKGLFVPGCDQASIIISSSSHWTTFCCFVEHTADCHTERTNTIFRQRSIANDAARKQVMQGLSRRFFFRLSVVTLKYEFR